ncbi:MAG: hypothetical protein KDD11_21840 [Acidobacteria bacterium]|nr:hypothetical protein [Acidobacteriota bacterium]
MPTSFEWRQNGYARPLDAEGVEPRSDCIKRQALIVSGTGVTKAAGEWHVNLQSILCEHYGYLDDPSFVATPTFHGEMQPEAVFVTTEWLTLPGGDLELGVRSWDHRGHPAPRIPFSWHLRVYLDVGDMG